MCFVWISEQTAIISLYNINWLVFITETECVYCAVRIGSLYIIQISRSLKKSWQAIDHFLPWTWTLCPRLWGEEVCCDQRMTENLRHQDSSLTCQRGRNSVKWMEFNDVRSVVLNRFCIRPVRIERSFGTQAPRFETSVPSYCCSPNGICCNSPAVCIARRRFYVTLRGIPQCHLQHSCIMPSTRRVSDLW